MPVPHESGDAIHYSGTGSDGAFFALFDVYFGGWGARPTKDGIDGVAPVYMGSYGSIAGELIERQYPVQLLGFGYVPDTAGPGKYRGSVGVYRAWRFLEAGKVMLRQLRLSKASGLNGGGPGELGTTRVSRFDGSVATPPAQSHLHIDIAEGDRLYHSISGAGGFGNPFERDPDDVLADVLDEKVSTTAALRDYGVVIHGGSVDDVATRRHRAARSPQPNAAAVRADALASTNDEK
jgi:N-methylhydantoinase B